ncbi:cysteine hydrolase family protein [Anaerocolumna xylanovorans]|uniref:Nicotinamidase-related amidase n=1 Tax=Anaerocolumna xylanovorans DSM 12503 TaxID=1121345 RepID=A0A1M7YK81_9FIRM|nr:cysteine hydrolase family protein [Anaerocolumna xylanovorans]SHO52938.1 Nicotinamidase-related amidase [Anaerocolumna xylanovorans DSM 12503]
MKSAIVLIDIQNDYFEGGKNELHHSDKAAVHAKQALNFFRNAKMPVYHVQHVSGGEGATFFLPDTNGAEIHKSVTPLAEEKVFVKHAPNAFYNTGLSGELLSNGINHLVICGMMSHMCIDTTVRAAWDYGFSVTVLEDACTTMDLVLKNGAVIPAETVHNTFMASLNGTFAKVLQADDLCHGELQ